MTTATPPSRPSSASPGSRSSRSSRSSVRLSVAVQHHPSRARLLPRILERAPGAEVVADPEPGAVGNPWRTYRLALDSTPAWATHRLILQDDTEPCRLNFLQAVGNACAARPGRPIALFHGGQPSESVHRLCRAAHAGYPWVEIRCRWAPVVALVWPAELIGPALEWADGQRWPAAFQSDDDIAGRCFTALGVRPLATVPSLVQHRDEEPSLVGHRAMGGKDPYRTAMCWLEDDEDPLDIDFATEAPPPW